MATFLRALAGLRNAPLWVRIAATGLRFGEAAALRWQDVDLAQRVIHVRHTLGAKGAARSSMFTPPQTDNGRRGIPLPQIAVQVLVAQSLTDELECQLPG